MEVIHERDKRTKLGDFGDFGRFRGNVLPGVGFYPLPAFRVISPSQGRLSKVHAEMTVLSCLRLPVTTGIRSALASSSKNAPGILSKAFRPSGNVDPQHVMTFECACLRVWVGVRNCVCLTFTTHGHLAGFRN